MVTVVLLVVRQRVRAAGHSLAGDRMLPRLRNASIALVATVTAVGLGLTLFIAQLGFPGVFSSPIPANQTKAGSVHDAVALTHDHAVAQSAPAPGGRSAAVNTTRPRHAGGAGGDSGSGRGDDHGVRGSQQVAATPGTPPGPAGEQPVSSIPVSAAPTPAAPPAEPPAPPVVPAAVETPPKTSSDEHSKGAVAGVVKQSTPFPSKAASDGGGKSKSQQTTKSDGHVAAMTKSDGGPAEKAGEGKSAAAVPKAPAPPPPPPPTAKAPEPASPAAAKEAAGSGKSDRPRH